MAYQSFIETGGAAPGFTRRGQAPETGFTALEWWVIASAQRERLASLDRPGFLARFFGSAFSGRADASAGDPRLAALRRIAILAWHKSYVVAKSEIVAFLAAGFTPDQYETLQASIARGKAKARDARAARPAWPPRQEWIALEASHGLS